MTGLPNETETLGEKQLEDPQVPQPLSRKLIVINWQFLNSGAEEAFGCKLSCTAAFIEKARLETLVLRTKGTKIQKIRHRKERKNSRS